MDSIWKPQAFISVGRSSPSTPPLESRSTILPPPSNMVVVGPQSSILPPFQIPCNIEMLRQWLFELPIHLVEEVIQIGMEYKSIIQLLQSSMYSYKL